MKTGAWLQRIPGPKLDIPCLVLLSLALRIIWFTGPRLLDDLTYAETATRLLNHGWPETEDIFLLRIGFTGILALCFKGLGVHMLSLALPSLVASLVLVGLTYLLASRSFGRATGVAAAILLAISPLDVFFATEAHTDLCVAACTAAAAFLILPPDPTKSWPRGFYAGLFMGLSHLFKEASIIPLIALLLLVGLRRNGRKSAGALLGGYASILLLESAGYWIGRGDFFHRIRVVAEHQRVAVTQPFFEGISTSRRVFLEFPGILFNPLHPDFVFMGLLPWSFLIAASALLRYRQAAAKDFILWWAIIFVLMDLWPIRILPYQPAMIAFPWIFLNLGAPAAIVAGHGLVRLGRRSGMAMGASFLLIAAVNTSCSWSLCSDVRARRRPVESAVAAIPPGAAVYTDPRTAQLMRFYRGYPREESVFSWESPPPGGEFHLVDYPLWHGTLERYYGLQPPPQVAEWKSKTSPILEYTSKGRLRIRPLLRGRIERCSWPPLRIYRIQPGTGGLPPK